MYDAVIIGAGIGGLVCACTLAKAGMKVLIVEQHSRPGGYCTSFRRGRFLFDAGPHCFGSYREGGILRKILSFLQIDSRLNVLRSDPSDTLITPGYRLSFWNDKERTIADFEAAFPKERSALRRFFSLLLDTHPRSFSTLRKVTLQHVLDQHFSDPTLKAVLATPLLGVHGLPPSLISAFVAAKLYSEFLFDGGYAPVGGMQQLPDCLATRFREYGGELRLSTRAMKISVEADSVKGVLLQDGFFAAARTVISNCDARQTLFSLLDEGDTTSEFQDDVRNMIPTVSNFIVYLGLKRDFQSSLNQGTFYYHAADYDVEQAYETVTRGNENAYSGLALRLSFDGSTLYTGRPASYRPKDYWIQNKNKTMEEIISRLDERVIPGLLRHIEYKDAATPYTLERYTLNYHGASYGWAGTPAQTIRPELRKPPRLRNLYHVGHWTTFGVGVSGVAYVGFDTANSLIKRYTVGTC